jgi:mutual gliding-motility protein MglA
VVIASARRRRERGPSDVQRRPRFGRSVRNSASETSDSEDALLQSCKALRGTPVAERPFAMAHLNVRDKVIEAKVAYVGAERSGKRTNFMALHAQRGAIAETFVGDGAFLALDVTPDEHGRFNDCALVVKLVGQRGVPTASGVATLVEDADGVVVVVDAAASAVEANRRSVELVRATLRERAVPVVVQINKTDLADAVPAEEVALALDLAAWPYVPAVAANGNGVRETFNRVVRDMVQSMTQSDPDDDTTPGSTEAPKGDGHPLLSALRRVLESTAEHHAKRLAEDLAVRLERRLDVRLDTLAARLDAVESATGALRANLTATEKLIDAVNDRVAATEAGTDVLRHQLATCTDELLKSARHACSREDLMTSASDLRAEVVRAIDAAAVATRDYVTSTSTVLKRSVESVGADVKKGTSRDAVTDVVARLEELDGRAQAIASSVQASSAVLASLTARSNEGEAAISREIREAVGRRLAAIDEAIKDLSAQTGASVSSAGDRAARLEALIGELIEELKKPKKGWFG